MVDSQIKTKKIFFKEKSVFFFRHVNSELKDKCKKVFEIHDDFFYSVMQTKSFMTKFI